MIKAYYKNSKGEVLWLTRAPFRTIDADWFDSTWEETEDGYEKVITLDVFGKREEFMVIYGPCVNPKVLMNGYPYEVLTTLEKNEYLIINSSEQTIMKYLSNGTTANLFDVRGYDYSVFEKIPSGLISVNWSGDFGIDLYVFLKRKEAAW